MIILLVEVAVSLVRPNCKVSNEVNFRLLA